MLSREEKIEIIKINQERQRRSASKSLYEFLKLAWPIIEPGLPFIEGWHLKAICEHLEAVHRGEIKNLLINIPPRHAKSSIVSVAYPAWEWIHTPNHKFIYASHAYSLSKRDSIKCRLLVTSDWYKETFKIKWELSDDQNEKMKFNNTLGGSRRAASVGGSVVGEGSDTLVIDDPHSPMDVHSDTMRENVINWHDQEFSSRVNDPKTASKIIIMQRLHEGDLSQHVLDKGGWEHLCLPAEFEGDKEIQTSIGWSDPRTEIGDPLWPERFGKQELDIMKKDMGVIVAAGQLQQHPTPPGGAMFTTEMFEYVDLPSQFDWSFITADTAYKEKQENDFNVFSAWGVIREKLYLRDVWRAKIKAVDVEAPAEAFIRKFIGYGFRGAYIEPKGHGIYLNQAFMRKGIMMPTEKQVKEFFEDRRLDKVQRANNIIPHLSNKKIYINKEIPNKEQLVMECLSFPKARHDDFCDTLVDSLKMTYAKKLSILDVL